MKLALWLMLAGACGSSGDRGVARELGARCGSDADCAEHCLAGSAWPDGMCTLACGSNADCPDLARCIAEDGGACAFACGSAADCAFLGSAYGCEDVDAVTGGAQVAICRGS